MSVTHGVPGTIVYRVGDGAYVNLTNRCPSACTFCLRQTCDAVGRADSLWLTRDVTAEEAVQALDAFDDEGFTVADASEVVFCGFGEPTENLSSLLAAAAHVKERWHKRVRVNTNGQGSLVNGRDITPELATCVDEVSVSLNHPDPARYQELVRSSFGDEAFPALLEFVRRARENGMEATLTTVATTITAEEEARCAEPCAELGARHRIHPFVD
ncbi:TatD family nuclease-associated radical SAM protein [Olsenella sp. YH-ols2217]|uniref:TatD family nuclease-associated radical SAM protein n=1 Tax=Kribbibacterium absianum TaxID=3044210 RepID=A0ABT6ZKP0_9ACTN|nr:MULTISPECIES: TatD family nuclease-associated radical SAM protein [unclassified Olsenella]MDJ1121592.1 TatD family nuclease-associated radical SAM protein [Olsenella sp. YH-ols2216]MDJ1129600.1 TatD family nuclease-associated radical SAM protein [Olsenella sp. YH-ols2217]